MNDLLVDVEHIKSILISRATNEQFSDQEYRILREKLLKTERIKRHLPRFISTCRNLSEFWGHITEISSNYKGRREYLREEFNELLTLLEIEKSSPADNIITQSLTGRVDASYIQDAWSKALERRETDPEGATRWHELYWKVSVSSLWIKQQ